jgi:uncharacterized membrane protein
MAQIIESMRGARETDRPEDSPDRLLTLSDGVFGVALTLLVLDIPAPGIGDAVGATRALHQALPHLAAAGFSFALIAGFWRDHRRTFLWVRKVDGLMIRLTLTGLFTVSVIPFPAALLARYGAQRLPMIVFADAMVLMALMQMALFSVVWRRDHLQALPVTADVGRSIMMDLGSSALVFAASIAIAFSPRPLLSTPGSRWRRLSSSPPGAPARRHPLGRAAFRANNLVETCGSVPRYSTFGLLAPCRSVLIVWQILRGTGAAAGYCAGRRLDFDCGS